VLRASGIAWDLRKTDPYCGYETYDFDVVTSTRGDSYGRFLCRVGELRESLKIIEQALDRLEPGPVMVEDTKIAWPAQLALGADGMGQSLDHVKKIMGTSMEALIHHFKLVTEGFRVPPGQVYTTVESPRGELGLPRRQRRRHPALPRPRARPELHQPAGDVGHVRGRHARRRHRRRRRHRPRDGWSRPMRSPEGTRTAREHADLRGRHRRDGTTDASAAAGTGGLTEQTRQEAREIIARYPQPRSAAAADAAPGAVGRGLRQPAGHRAVREELGLTKAEVGAVATFYTMYRRRPAGEYHVGVCTNTLCAVLGGDAIMDSVKEQLGIGHNETTDDGLISLEHIECNAACDYAPVVMVNWEFYDDQTPSSVRELVDACRAGSPPPPTRGRHAVHVQAGLARARRLPRRPRRRGRAGRAGLARRPRAGAGARRERAALPGRAGRAARSDTSSEG
jgi:NADH:ubiquinone oxidoreductase subunit E